MWIFGVLGYAISLSMDAFAVSTCKGLAMKRAGLKEGVICGLWFGGFQALMPTIGFFLAMLFAEQIRAIDHWVAFVLLAIIGGLNWGSIGLFRFDLVAWIFGGQTALLSRVVYTLVGLAALWCISLLFRARDEADEEA